MQEFFVQVCGVFLPQENGEVLCEKMDKSRRGVMISIALFHTRRLTHRLYPYANPIRREAARIM